MEKKMIKPLGERVLVKLNEELNKTAGGIIIPDGQEDKPSQGEVVALGSGIWSDGHYKPLEVAVGDVVIFGRFSGTEVDVDGKPHLVMKESDLIAISC
jgi:chaperonin GroES